MPSGNDFANNNYVKMLLIGDSGTGKTGSMLSLLQAGYKLRIIDLDGGVNTLIQYTRKFAPELLANISYEQRRDKTKAGPSGISSVGVPKAFNESMTLLDKWTDETSPAEWGQDHIMVIDSLTALSRAAFAWFARISPSADKRQVYHQAQQAVLDFLYNITADEFRTNVIIIGHVNYNESQTKGWAKSVGQAISEDIPALFNNFFQVEKVGSGEKARRVIKTFPSGPVAVKSEIAFDLPKELPLETGLATLFSMLKGN
jgi:hypothetical protein